jgi:hypothetical protein
MENTNGFYKIDNENLCYAPNAVISCEYMLEAFLKDTYEYPIDGWHWFDSEDDARIFFNIPLESNTTE